jgi:hypothetical protein
LVESCRSRRQGDKTRSRRKEERGGDADGRKKRRQKEEAVTEGRKWWWAGGRRRRREEDGDSLTVMTRWPSKSETKIRTIGKKSVHLCVDNIAYFLTMPPKRKLVVFS